MGPSVIVISLGLIRHDQDVAKPNQEEQLQVWSEVTVTYNKFFANVCNSIFIIFTQSELYTVPSPIAAVAKSLAILSSHLDTMRK